MTEISLKRKNNSKNETAISAPSESYPSFTIYDDAPQALMDAPMGSVLIAKIKKVSEEKRTGTNARNSVGFDVISVSVSNKKKSVAETILGG